MPKIDLEKLSTEYCSEPYELNAKKVVHMIPDIVAELRASRALREGVGYAYHGCADLELCEICRVVEKYDKEVMRV